MTTARKNPRTVVGIVTSSKMNKTIVVKVDRMVEHPVYHKYVHKPQVFRAHDEANTARAGARVRLAATRPLSKTKRWRLVQIIEQGPEE